MEHKTTFYVQMQYAMLFVFIFSNIILPQNKHKIKTPNAGVLKFIIFQIINYFPNFNFR
jgi:hypothetical protein